MAEEIKSFQSLKTDELDEVAKAFGVDFPEKANKNEKLSELAENGVTVDMWNEINALAAGPGEGDNTQQASATPPAEKTEEPEEEKVLIKMTRFNNTYHIRGYHFSRTHPFALVSEDDADYLCRVDGGFTMATPSEAREYYG